MPIRSLLKRLRTERGLSVAEVANRVSVTRQTIYAIEDGTFVPNTAVALQLAKVLGVRVEEIFSLDEESDTTSVEAELLPEQSASHGQLVRLCRVGDRVKAFVVSDTPAFLPNADGVVEGVRPRTVFVRVEAVSKDRKQLLVAGCDPALSFLVTSLQAYEIDIVLVPCSSRRALKWLKEGRVHVAGSHLLDQASGDYNVPIIRKLMQNTGVRVVTFAAWEQGLLVQRGNPKAIRSVADLGSRGMRIVNREKGSGSRDLLDSQLVQSGVEASRISGYDSIAAGHLAAARMIALGEADCCVAPLSAARCFGLDFIPIAQQRFDLSFSASALDLEASKVVLDTLTRLPLRKKLREVAGYDSAHSGEVLV